MRILCLYFVFLVSVQASSAIDYKSEIMPIMKQHCWDCHSGDDYKGSLNLDKLGEMSYHIGKFNVIRPGNAEESSFLEKMLLPEGHSDFMPRKGSKLPDDELAKIREWIDKGAVVDKENPDEEEKQWVAKMGGASSGPSREFLKWTSSDGRVIEARFLGIQGEAVKLVMKNGTAYTVPFNRLSKDSVDLANQLAEN